MTRLLILRPQPGADVTAARARALGFDAVVAPLFEIRPVAWDAPDPAHYDALLMTSANAARRGGPQLSLYRHLPVFAVGAATARAATEAGFEKLVIGERDGAAVIARARNQRLLHLAGREHVALPGIDRCIVYAADPVETSPPPADIALLHSARAARHFAALANDRRTISIAALSRQVAEAAGEGWRVIAVAEQPNDESLLAAAAQLCDQGTAGDG